MLSGVLNGSRRIRRIGTFTPAMIRARRASLAGGGALSRDGDPAITGSLVGGDGDPGSMPARQHVHDGEQGRVVGDVEEDAGQDGSRPLSDPTEAEPEG